MAIVFGGDAGIQPGAFDSVTSRITQEFQRLKNGFLNVFGDTIGIPPSPPLVPVYVDDGFTNVPGTAFVGSQFSNIDDIKTRRITTQEPSLTVYIKKKAFWSLRSEHDIRFMDASEKLLMRATKMLFEKKCIQLAAYEALTKAARLISEDSEYDALIIDAIADNLEEFFGNAVDSLEADALTAVQTDPTNIAFNNQIVEQLEELKRDEEATKKLINNFRRLSQNVRKSKQATQTNWVIDADAASEDVLGVGRGSGVIELTLVSSLTTALNLASGDKGSVQFTIQDPYNLTKITSSEIEGALAAAAQEIYDIETALQSGASTQDVLSAVNLGATFYLEEARKKEDRLNKIRRDKVSNSFGLSGSSTGPVGTAGAPEIVFEVNPTSFGNKISISITSLPASFHSATAFSIALISLPIEHQLGIEEVQLVTEIFDLLTLYVDAIQRLSGAIQDFNANPSVEYARRKLRQSYLGKSMIQPMDGIHIYMRGNTFRDGQVVGPLNAILNNSNYIQSFSENNNMTDPMLEEEMRLFGIDEIGISVDLYRQIRTGSFLRNAGTHVFGGLVSSSSERYSADSGYLLDISGESSMKWLDISRANTKPSFEQTQGLLEDPLTLHQLEIDEGTGLVKTEPQLLPQNKERLDKLNYIDGVNQGKKPSEEDTKQDYFPTGNGSAIPVFQHAPGLVYRWKEGIITATRDVNLRSTLDGSGVDSEKLRRELGVNVVENPFSSADAADVVSIMVTGFPHNYESFVINAQSIGTYTFGHGNSSESFFHSFFDVLRTQNRTLGDFQPFKLINISQKQMAERLRIQTELRDGREKLKSLRSEIATFQDQLDAIETGPDALRALGQSTVRLDAQRSGVAASLSRIIQDLRGQIARESAQFNRTINEAPEAGLRVYGNDFAFEIEKTTGGSTEEESAENDKKLRLKNRMLQLRSQLKCKFNSDTNLFIISDDYDKDLDIQAFVLKLAGSSGPALWESSYDTPYNICCNVAKILDFEFFCDTQGHIQFRPPKYNKIPLSLLLKLFILDRKENKRIYPVFLEQLFKNRQRTYADEAEIKELEIRENLILLGGNIDIPEQANTSPTDESTSAVFTNLMDTQAGLLSENELKDRSRLLIQTRNEKASKIGGSPKAFSDEELAAAAKEISQYNVVSGVKNPNINVNRLSIVNQVAQLVSVKQGMLNVQKRLGGEIERFEDTRKSSLAGGGNRRLSEAEMANLIAPFENLIENDLFDDLGPSSSARFIISDDQIISYEFTESDSDIYCRVDVTGAQDLLSTDGTIGNVPVLWAGATDFDMWRQYGWRSQGSINKPFLHDAALQCAPYALMLLSRNRRNAVKGSITVTGNEYYQLGDVVYLNTRDMLYYVTGVRHTFSYEGSGSFTTTLELRYGHPLGDYIPTPLDVIGKSLIKNQVLFNSRITSRETANKKSGVSLGFVSFPNSSATDVETVQKEMLAGGFGKFNLQSLKNALLKANSHITNAEFPKIEVRGFFINEADKDKVSIRMGVVEDWLTNPVSIGLKGEMIPLPEKDFNKIKSDGFSPVDPVNVKLPSEEDIKAKRVPKEEAFGATLPDGDPTNVIDITLVFA